MTPPRALVTAASRHGATTEIATAIADALATAGVVVELAAVDEVEDMARYDAVVLGSAVYVGKWLESTRRLVERHAADRPRARSRRATSGARAGPPRPAAEEAVNVEAIVELTSPVEHRLFAGKLDRSKLGFGERALVRAVGAREGDCRDWEEIRRWAEEVAVQITPLGSRRAEGGGPS